MLKKGLIKHCLLASVAVFSLSFISYQSIEVHASESSYTSYNPTEPEVQLGYVKLKKMTIDESGTITLDKHINIQGSIEDLSGEVYIEAVKRPKIFRFDDGDKLTLYYFLDKSGDIFSMNLKEDKYLEDTEGNRAKIKLVKSIEGKNGVADGDGFKSNLVPEKFLPKTGLDSEKESLLIPDEYSKRTMISTYSIIGISFLICLFELFIKRKLRGGLDDD